MSTADQQSETGAGKPAPRPRATKLRGALGVLAALVMAAGCYIASLLGLLIISTLISSTGLVDWLALLTVPLLFFVIPVAMGAVCAVVWGPGAFPLSPERDQLALLLVLLGLAPYFFVTCGMIIIVIPLPWIWFSWAADNMNRFMEREAWREWTGQRPPEVEQRVSKRK